MPYKPLAVKRFQYREIIVSNEPATQQSKSNTIALFLVVSLAVRTIPKISPLSG